MLHRFRPHFRLRRHPGPQTQGRHVDRFERLAAWTVHATDGRWGFRLAMLVFIAWLGSGSYFNYHASWATTYSLATTTVTFLLVFLIQNAQNRESKAIHLKLDELVYAAKNARNELIHIEHMTEEQLDLLGERYRKLAERHQGSLDRLKAEVPGRRDAGLTPGRAIQRPDCRSSLSSGSRDSSSTGLTR